MFEIYLTTNLVNGKKYIGQHKLSKHYDYYLGSGKLLKQAIEKYGKENFKKETLIFCETQEEANEQEKYCIDLFNAVHDDNFYNLAEGGSGGGFTYYKEYLDNNPEEKERIKQKRLKGLKEWQQNNPEILKQIGQQNMQKCIEWRKQHPDKMQQIYEQNKEENASHLKKWMEENPEEALEYRQRGSEALKKWNEEHPEEAKKNLSLGPQANKMKNGKRVRCVNTGEIFLSIADAERAYNLCKDAVGRCLRGQVKTAGKHPLTGERLKWEYYIEVTESARSKKP